MREAKIICPSMGNDGADLTLATYAARDALVDAFGGATMSQAMGSWRAPSGEVMTEHVRELVCAYAPSPSADAQLRGIACRFAHAAKQLAVYVRFASGAVEIIDTAHLWRKEAT